MCLSARGIVAAHKSVDSVPISGNTSLPINFTHSQMEQRSGVAENNKLQFVSHSEPSRNDLAANSLCPLFVRVKQRVKLYTALFWTSTHLPLRQGSPLPCHFGLVVVGLAPLQRFGCGLSGTSPFWSIQRALRPRKQGVRPGARSAPRHVLYRNVEDYGVSY